MNVHGEIALPKLSPIWMKDKATGLVIGFFFVCPACPPPIMGMCAHPIILYTQEVYALAHGRECWTMRGKTFDTLSVLGRLELPGCRFKGWISKGQVRW